MNILLINHYAGNPQLGMEFRPYYLAKEWIKQGHKVLIVGATYSHLRKEQPAEGLQTYDGVDYLWLKTNTYSGNGIKRLWSMFAFVFHLYSNAKQLVRFSPDAVIASSTYPLDIYPARYIAKRAKAKLVFEIHDLWPLSPMEIGGMSKYHPFIMMMQWAENYAYKHCDRCISILPCVHDHVKAHGLNLEKLHLVPNGIVLEDWKNPKDIPQEHHQLINTLKNKGEFLVCFAGSHGKGNSLKYVIESVSNLVNEKISLVLVGTGLEKPSLMKLVEERNISNVYFLSSIEKPAIPTLLGEMDLLYIGIQREPLYRFGISPNKMFDYMMAGRPILQAIESGNNMVKEAQCGVFVEPDNVIEIQKGILEIKNRGEQERAIMGENGRKFVLSNHTYQSLSSQYLQAIS